MTSKTIELNVDGTKSDLSSGMNIYMYIVGLVSSKTEDTYYYLDVDGVPHSMQTTDNKNKQFTFPDSDILSKAAVNQLKTNYPLDWADYSIPVSQSSITTINLANINTINCPGLGTGTAAFSGRIYFSIGIPRLPFTPIAPTGQTKATGYTAPIPNTGVGSQTLFDWIEFSFDSENNFNGNTTQVDQFGFPLTLNGRPGGALQGELNLSRSKIMEKFGSSMSAPFGQGILQVKPNPDTGDAYPSGLTFLRLISPKTMVSPATYSGDFKTYFDDIVSSWYKTWETTPLVTQDKSTGYYTGIVPTEGTNRGKLTFYQGKYKTLGDLKKANPTVVYVFENTISSYDIWQCANSLASGSSANKNFQKMIAAAFNRGAMSNSLQDLTCNQNAASFYPSNVKCNQWAEQFHEISKNKLAYGFPYDDVCNQNPSIDISNTTSISIVIGKFYS